MTTFDVRIPGLPITVVQTDGNDVEPVTVDEFRISVAETYDVIVQPNDASAFTIFAQSADRTGYARATLAPRPGMSAPIPPMDPRPMLTMADMGMSMKNMPGMEMSNMPAMKMETTARFSGDSRHEHEQHARNEDGRYARDGYGQHARHEGAAQAIGGEPAVLDALSPAGARDVRDVSADSYGKGDRAKTIRAPRGSASG